MKKAGFMAGATLAVGMAFGAAAQADTKVSDFYKMDWSHKGSIAASGVDFARNKAKQEGNQLLQSCISYAYPLDKPEQHDAAVDALAVDISGVMDAYLRKGYTLAQLDAKPAEKWAEVIIKQNCKERQAASALK
jgi:opacity protein-like surface antigen